MVSVEEPELVGAGAGGERGSVVVAVVVVVMVPEEKIERGIGYRHCPLPQFSIIEG